MIVLVGQAPSMSGDPRRPLEGASGRKMASLLGMTFDEYLRNTHRVNIFKNHQGRLAKGDKFPLDRAKKKTMRLQVPAGAAVVLLLGKNVAAAFGIRNAQFFDQRYMWPRNSSRIIEVRVVPHPSGVSRWWNEPENRRTAARRFAEIVRAARHGHDV